MEKLAIDTNADSVYTNNSLLTDNLEFFEVKKDTTEEEKEAFYDPLGKLYDDCFRNDIKFLLEDMNAKIGKDSACSVLEIIRTVNQADHSFRLLDVSVNRNVNLDNDHFLLVARLKARTSHTRNQKRIRSVRYNTCMLKKEKRKKIYESKADEIPVFPLDLSEVLEEMKAKNEAYNLMIQKKRSRVYTERYRDARNEEKRIHRAKKRKSMMTQMEPIQKYSTKHLSREIFRTMNDNRRAFISRTKNFISKMDEIISDTQVDKDNVFDELDDTDSYKDIRPSNEEVHKAV
ncbi:hypothetical protein CWI37_0107p0020 [Hamiltosporidium tvaerminnensis]|uniref:Uncharacterized protein n=1 Tax=Hamiltosporidium tvaerminnensis TaxID=1176355 RepID=A0A4Q9LCY7_9MICR|nr:hypothetical protein CWI37_0363p0020 [Hamiltosporidium tvaerminnensis]TBU04640.1 hypothetical protein CWI37_0107p0020 [Hamiltosporidium tvaerminnensis]